MPTAQQTHPIPLYPSPHAPIHQRRTRQPIHLSCLIPADIRRVFCAISLPEYLEAWLRPPDPAEQLDFHLAAPQRLHIDLSRDGAPRTRIHASIHILCRNHVGYAWTSITPAAANRSAVDLQLTPTPTGCRLALTHSAPDRPIDRAWNREMWAHSLARLRTLVTAPMRPIAR
jgi:uncharacterized protein YndB with AHSA1/START domain